jgi:hypothetical protein
LVVDGISWSGFSIRPSTQRSGLARSAADSSPHARRVPLQPNLHRSRTRSWAERHHYAIGLVLTLVGFAAVGAIQFLGVSGSLATTIGAFAVFAFLLDGVSAGTAVRFSRLLRSITRTSGSTWFWWRFSGAPCFLFAGTGCSDLQDKSGRDQTAYCQSGV